MQDRGVLVIVSSPSGAGKTTLTRKLIAEFGNLAFSVSFTTRPMRPGEADGSDYHFVSAETFEAMVQRGDFAEWAWVHGNRYGTARAPIDSALVAGRDLIFDVDWQGGDALSNLWPTDVVKVFILPPNLNALATRLRTRATDSADVIDRRLHKAIEELRHFHDYPYLIINDQVDRAYQILRAVYLTRRYGRQNRDDVPHPLAELAKVVDDNVASSPDAHARELIREA